MCFAGFTGGSTDTSGSGGFGMVAAGMQVAGALTSAFGAYKKSEANKAALEYQAKVADYNAKIDDWRASDAITRGQTAVGTQQLKTAALKGTQRAKFAARGMALDEGSPLAILMDTEYMGGVDAATISDNANKEAWALRNTAAAGRANAAMLENRAVAESPLAEGAGQLLAGAGTVASTWYRLRTGTTGTAGSTKTNLDE